jgi:hypothetical protein
MHHWLKRIFVAAAPLLLTGCLWGPGKFTSQLTLHKDGSFVLDYRGEMVLQIPKDEPSPVKWSDSQAYCIVGKTQNSTLPVVIAPPPPAPPPSASAPKRPPPVIVAPRRPCTAAEIAQQREAFEKNQAATAEMKRAQAENMAKMFGLPGFDDASNRAFAAKVMKYAGWRSVTYRGNGVYDVDYHFAGRATQDFVFPELPDNDLLLPFIALRRRADGSVLVTAPAFTGGAGPLMERMAAAGAAGNTKTGMVSHAQGRFTVITDGEILTNNSEDGPSATAAGREVHWDVNAESKKIPETLIRL